MPPIISGGSRTVTVAFGRTAARRIGNIYGTYRTSIPQGKRHFSSSSARLVTSSSSPSPSSSTSSSFTRFRFSIGFVLGALVACVPTVILYANNGDINDAAGKTTTLKKGNKKVPDIRVENMGLAASRIAAALGEDAVSRDAEVIEAHGHSDWSTSNSAGRATAVVYPRSTEDVSRIARICYELDVPMVPYGAGSSVEGNFSAPYGGICIDFTLMNEVVAFHPDDMDVVVQPGVNWVDLNRQIRDSGLFLPLDPSPTATIGGMVSTNCSGTNAFRYGTMKDWVVALTVVLADGTVVRTRRRPRKTSAGYNLTALVVGAEGTLGLVTEATLRLAPVPRATGVAVVAFPSLRAAADAAARLIHSGLPLAALELMDDVQMAVLNKHGSPAVRRTRWPETPTLFLKFAAATDDAVRQDVARTREVVRPFAPAAFFLARDKREEEDLWAARKEALWTMTSIKPPGYSLWSTDVAVPISRLADLIDASKRESAQLGLFASVIGHVGDGNFHQAVMYDPTNPEHVASVSRCVQSMMERALEMEGTVTGEHGIGIGKKDCLVDELGPETLRVMRALKQAVDPKWLLNPGKVFDPPENE